MDIQKSVVSAEEMNAFFDANFKGDRGQMPDIIQAEADHVIMRAQMSDANIRPGGFISGPTQMAMADHMAYVVIFTRLGITPMALTSNLNIDFLRPCIGEQLHIEGRMIKLGRSLAVVSVEMRGEDNDKISSRATLTYALPHKTT
jgi:uncharacterized protein (TIGR00369 family)